MSADYTSVSTVVRIPPPSPHSFNPLYVAATEERAESVEEEKSKVEELRMLLQRHRCEYRAMTHEISRSRTRFNAVAYISRLPEEILTMIFEAYVADHWEAYYPLDRERERFDRRDVTPYCWIKNVLHVCREWRRIALSTPRLWTIIAHDRVYEPWRLDFLLEHAGGLPLTLRNDKILVKEAVPIEVYDSDDDSDDSNRRTKTIYYEDNRGLALFPDTLQMITQLETVSLIVTPEMEQFLTTIQDEDDSEEDIDALSMRYLWLDLSSKALEDTPLFVNVNMPRLQSLTLRLGQLELVQRLACSSLTRLDVSFGHNISLSELLDVLEDAPGLRQLLVNRILPGDVIPQRSVPLLSLEHLRVNGPIHTSGQLLNQLVFPIGAMIELHTRDELTFSLLSPFMPTILGCTASDANLDCIGPHTLRIRERYADCRYMTTSVWFWGMAAPSAVPDTSFTQAALSDQAGGPRLNVVCPWETFRLDGLNTTNLLSLHVGRGIPRAYWAEVFRRPAFLKLETLCIDDPYSINDVFLGLIALAEQASPVAGIANSHPVHPPSTDLPLPCLKMLILNVGYILTTEGGQIVDRNKLLPLLQRCAHLGYRFPLVRLADICFYNAADKVEGAAILQDAVSKLGIADVVEIETVHPRV